jgi:hypothetical protein
MLLLLLQQLLLLLSFVAADASVAFAVACC